MSELGRTSKAEYELQRRMNTLLAQLPPAAARDAAVTERIVGAQAELEGQRQSGSKPASSGTLMGGDTTGIDVKVQVRMIQVPTSFVHLLDPAHAPLVTFQVQNMRDKKARLKFVTRVDGYSSDAIDTVEMDPGQQGTLPQLPTFLVDRVATVNETRAASLYVRVEDLDGRVEQETTYRIILLPRTSAYLSVEDGAGGVIDLTPYIAAWITPNASEVMALVRDAAALHPQRSIVGYQPADAPNLGDIVREQVRAIFGALKAKEVTYVNSVVAFNLAGDTFVQRIRLPRESLQNRSANCIDGVVLMASALEAASLNPAIVLIPGHAFLAFELKPETDQWDFVETTMIGSHTFDQAVAVGRQTAGQLMQKSEAEGQPHIRILPLTRLRTELRIFPME